MQESHDSKNDQDKWLTGWQRYTQFFNELSVEDKESLMGYTTNRLPIQPRSLQALFLGEKPACFEQIYPTTVQNLLRDYGFIVCGKYIGNGKEIEKIVNAHPQIFADFPSDPESLLQTLDNMENEKNSLQRGLLLGFPLSAVQVFGSDQKLKGFGVEDYWWVDSPESKVSKERQEILKRMFDTVTNTKLK